jgi:hypothetical protein
MTPAPQPADLTDSELERRLRDSRQLEDAPEHVIQRALSVWQPRRAPAAAAGLLQRVLAVLSFDSGLAPALAFGQRSAGGSPAVRQLLFTTPGCDVDLRIGRAAEGADAPWQLSGQLLGPAAQGRVTLQCGSWSAQVDWNALCEFRFDAVPAGPCWLRLHSDGSEIEVGPIALPPAP